jgi:hypothetical protein
MSINFPSNPVYGVTFSYGDNTWEYNGYAWDKLAASGGTTIIDYVSYFDGKTGAINIVDGGTY